MSNGLILSIFALAWSLVWMALEFADALSPSEVVCAFIIWAALVVGSWVVD